MEVDADFHGGELGGGGAALEQAALGGRSQWAEAHTGISLSRWVRPGTGDDLFL